ncbi:MAG: DUF5803 family protein [Methanomicrobiales archaeon]
MCTPHRDRRGPALAAVALAVALLVSPVLALEATIRVAPGGDSFEAEYTLDNQTSISLVRPGMLGEPVPIEAEDITVSGTDREVEVQGMGQYAVPMEARLLTFTAPLQDHTLRLQFDRPRNVTLHLPDGFWLDNPALGTVVPAGTVTSGDGETTVMWEQVRYVECRFYDRMQEIALFAFGGVWVAVVVVLLFSYVLVSRRRT